MLHGVLLIALFSCAAFYIGEMGFIKSLSLSPMSLCIILYGFKLTLQDVLAVGLPAILIDALTVISSISDILKADKDLYILLINPI